MAPEKCKMCADGRCCINGKYCLELKRYVEYEITPPCMRSQLMQGAIPKMIANGQ